MTEISIDELLNNYDNYSIQERHKLLKQLNKTNYNDHRINKLNDMHKNDIHYYGIKNLSLLTIINLIALPIGIIVGYFGMNFRNMGAPTQGKNNILNIKYPHLLVLSCCIISSIIFVYLFNRYYMVFDINHDDF